MNNDSSLGHRSYNPYSVKNLLIALKNHYADGYNSDRNPRGNMVWTSPQANLEILCGISSGGAHLNPEELERRRQNIDLALDRFNSEVPNWNIQLFGGENFGKTRSPDIETQEPADYNNSQIQLETREIRKFDDPFGPFPSKYQSIKEYEEPIGPEPLKQDPIPIEPKKPEPILIGENNRGKDRVEAELNYLLKIEDPDTRSNWAKNMKIYDEAVKRGYIDVA